MKRDNPRRFTLAFDFQNPGDDYLRPKLIRTMAEVLVSLAESVDDMPRRLRFFTKRDEVEVTTSHAFLDGDYVKGDPTQLRVLYDQPFDMLTVEGIHYKGEVFRGLGMFPHGTVVRIVKRENGVLWLEHVDMAKERLSPPAAPEGDEVAGVRDTLIVAANNPVAHGGLEGLRAIMLAQAERLRALAPVAHPRYAAAELRPVTEEEMILGGAAQPVAAPDLAAPYFAAYNIMVDATLPRDCIAVIDGDKRTVFRLDLENETAVQVSP